MRHVHREVSRYWWSRRFENHNHPYALQYTYERASMDKRYVQILDYIAKHPGCKRFDIICEVWKHRFGARKFTPKQVSGQGSLIFSNLLYNDLIDYDKQYRYTLTDRGYQVLDYAKFRKGE